MRKRLWSKTLCLILTIIMILGVLLPGNALAVDEDIKTLTFEFPEGLDIEREKTVAINNLYDIKSVEVDSGEVVNYYQKNDSVYVKVYNGDAIYKSHTMDVDSTVNSTTNTFASKITYNEDGYSGILNKVGEYTFNNPLFSQKYSGTVTNPKAKFYKYMVTIKYTENEAPKIALNKPQDGFAVNSSFDIEGFVTDKNIGDELSVKYCIEGETDPALIDQTIAQKNAFSFKDSVSVGVYDNLGIYKEGSSHKLNVWAEDKRGAKSVVKVVSFIIDRTPPQTPTIDVYPSGTPSKFDTVTIKYPTDAEGYYKIGKDGKEEKYEKPFEMAVNDAVYAIARDKAGNESINWFAVNNIDNIPPKEPQIIVTPGVESDNEPIKVKIITADESDIAQYKTESENDTIKSFSSLVSEGWIDGNEFEISEPGKTIISARAVDKAGNVSTEITLRVCVKGPTPTTDPNATPTKDPNATPTKDPNATPTTDPNATPTKDPNATPTTDPNATPTIDPNATPASNTTVTPTPTTKRKGSRRGGYFTIDEPTTALAGILDMAVYITSDKTRYEENEMIEFTVKYKNKADTEIKNVVISADVPENTTHIDGSGGTLNGNKVEWKFDKVSANAIGELKYKIKVNRLDKAESTPIVVASLKSDTKLVNTDDDESKFFVLLYSNRYDSKTHSKYITGYEDNSFRQENSITRAEVATIISQLLNLEKAAPAGKVYPDVSDSHWGYGYIYAATKTGLFTGYEDGTFHPDSFITRAEMTVVIAQYLKLKKIEPFSINFADINNHWAVSYIEEIYRVKFIDGYLEGSVRSFMPNASIKRSEAITMFNNVFFRGPLKGGDVPFNDITKEHWSYEQVAEASLVHYYIRDGKFETKVDKK